MSKITPLLRKALYDPSFWIILSVNIFCIYYYQQHTEGFATIVWIYWIQSVMIGLFNFLDLLTVKHPDPASMTINDKPIDGSLRSKGCTAFFFLFHYQFFHLVYAIFILTSVGIKVDFIFILLTMAAMMIELIISFIRNKRIQQTLVINYGQLFFMPYLRIVPMHIMILAPAFLGWQASTVFLVLKMIADAGMYLLTIKLYSKSSNSLLSALQVKH